MKTTQYVRQLKAIEAADNNLIREWWLWGLRLLRDPESISPSGASLRHGVAERLIAAAGKDAKGRPRLSVQKIQRALRCARAYPTESQIRRAATDFDGWYDLVDAGFPPYEAEEGEPPADHRNDAERQRDRARALAELAGDQGALFALSDFEPLTTTLKELTAYAAEMAELTERFAARDRKRQAYLSALIEAAGGDLSMTWQDAHDRLADSPADSPEPGSAASTSPARARSYRPAGIPAPAIATTGGPV
ncbi:hypothetical protein [Micromonospora endolithica]|uniref:Uncharacterized protein n=1 Tax=Micromonospora endolithica TaxID=230091 RepID=A0A3A9Z9Y6_9ACTN|nr:hypothetical protein [Micromonospora endolithica]RKN45231.1 hypothetical protein D7223_16435 [Micromonospora endolithica]TWJ23094.1 hypothetical protein JD76_03223 [Micromonospora endolithica]